MTGYDEPPPTPSGRWDAPAEFDEFVRSRHAARLRFAHLLTGARTRRGGWVDERRDE